MRRRCLGCAIARSIVEASEGWPCDHHRTISSRSGHEYLTESTRNGMGVQNVFLASLKQSADSKGLGSKGLHPKGQTVPFVFPEVHPRRRPAQSAHWRRSIHPRDRATHRRAHLVSVTRSTELSSRDCWKIKRPLLGFFFVLANGFYLDCAVGRVQSRDLRK